MAHIWEDTLKHSLFYLQWWWWSQKWFCCCLAESTSSGAWKLLALCSKITSGGAEAWTWSPASNPVLSPLNFRSASSTLLNFLKWLLGSCSLVSRLDLKALCCQLSEVQVSTHFNFLPTKSSAMYNTLIFPMVPRVLELDLGHFLWKCFFSISILHFLSFIALIFEH